MYRQNGFGLRAGQTREIVISLSTIAFRTPTHPRRIDSHRARLQEYLVMAERHVAEGEAQIADGARLFRRLNATDNKSKRPTTHSNNRILAISSRNGITPKVAKKVSVLSRRLLCFGLQDPN